MNGRNYAKHLLEFLALILKQWLLVEQPPGPGWGPGLGTCEGAEGPVNCSRALLGARRLACVLGVASLHPHPTLSASAWFSPVVMLVCTSVQDPWSECSERLFIEKKKKVIFEKKGHLVCINDTLKTGDVGANMLSRLILLGSPLMNGNDAE